MERPCDCGRVVAKGEHHCWEHHKDETTDETPFIVCGECWHIYQTAQELETLYNEEVKANGGPWRTVTDIFFCPLCIHDF